MNTTITSDRDYTYSGYFEGKPCEVIEEYHIILPHWAKMSFKEGYKFAGSREFTALTKAGIEVHSGTYS